MQDGMTEGGVGANFGGKLIEECEEEAEERISFATALLHEYNSSVPLGDLDSVVLKFRQVLSLDAPIKIKDMAMSGLAVALSHRFMLADQLRDFEESINLRCDLYEIRDGREPDSNDIVTNNANNIEDAEEILKLTKASLQTLQHHIPLHVLHTTIFILETTLSEFTLEMEQNRTQKRVALVALADGLYARYHHTANHSDLQGAMVNLRNAMELISDKEKTTLWVHLARRLCVMTLTKFDTTGELQDLLEGLDQFQSIEVASASVPEVSLLHVATDMYNRSSTSADINDLNSAIDLFKQAIPQIPLGDENHSAVLNNLANALFLRFETTGRQVDLDDAISLHRDILGRGTASDPRYTSFLNNLSSSLLSRYETFSQRGDLDEAISLSKESIKQQSHPHHGNSRSLNTLANALFIRFNQGGRQEDLNEAIQLHCRTLETLPELHPDRVGISINYAHCLSSRFEQAGQLTDLDNAISLYRQAVDNSPKSHLNHSRALNSLGSTLSLRFRQGAGERSDLDDALSFHRQALELQPSPHPQRYSTMMDLASTLYTLYEHDNQQANLDDAILLYKTASQHVSVISQLGSFYNLAAALWDRFRRNGSHDDLLESIVIHKQVLDQLPQSHSLRSVAMNSLAVALWAQFELSGKDKDLQAVILLHRQVLEFQEPSSIGHSDSLNNLAAALVTRFRKDGHRRDLDEAILLHTRALDLRPPPHPQRAGSLNNLASALLCRFEINGEQPDLDEAISLRRESLQLQGISPVSRARALSSLSSTLRIQFKKNGIIDDINEAISLYTEALGLVEASHPVWRGLVHNYAIALSTRYEYEPKDGDLQKATTLFREALDHCPLSDPGRTASYEGLGLLYAAAYSNLSSTHSKKQDYLNESMTAFSSALQCLGASITDRYRVAETWSFYADLYHHSSALEAYDIALHTLPQLVSLGLDVQSRREVISNHNSGLARRAARCAIAKDNLEKAIEYLETGRVIFWSQALRLRSPLEKLRAVAADLADNLQDVAAALDRGSYRQIPQDIDGLDNHSKLTLEEDSSRFEKLNNDWLKYLDEARALPGFEDFLLPRRIIEMKRAAASYPVVILVPNDQCSDCLIMTSTTIHHIALSIELCTDALQKLVDLTHSAVSHSALPRSLIGNEVLEDITQERLGASRRAAPTISSDDAFKHILQTLWTEVVKPVVDYLDIKRCDGAIAPPRVIWYPTGLFTFLPIHAAGTYNNTDAIERASDYITSSYTPTIDLLLRNEEPNHRPSKHEMLAVIDTKRLYSAKAELEKIKSHIPSDSLLAMGVLGTPAYVDDIFKRLPGAYIVHFACHGKQDRTNPLNSSLLVDDGELTISKIMQQPLPKGSLAFLCACETATGDESLPDEAMSLGASVLFAGFRNVVATMWKMVDSDGPLVADVFYAELFKGGRDGTSGSEPNFNRSAQALSIAVERLRSSGVEFRRWVPFIHFGK